VKRELGIGTHAACLAKYNGAQRLAYVAVLFMVAGEVVTGLAMAYHKELPWLVAALGGRHAVHAVHKFLMFGIIAFVVVHMIQVIRAGWPALRSMISGYDILPGTTAAAVDGAIPRRIGCALRYPPAPRIKQSNSSAWTSSTPKVSQAGRHSCVASAIVA
jgi:hypothetical protein